MPRSPQDGVRLSRAGIWLVVLVGLGVALASALLVDGARSAMPSAGQIAFTHGGIYVMRGDGSGVRLLRRGGPAWLAWSPDGSRLAFSSGGGTWVMDADGSDLVRIGPGEGSRRTWSPDGRRIAFSGQPEGRSRNGIWVMNADGSNLHRISTPRLDRMSFGGWGPFDVDWSSRGRLVFTAVEPGRTRPGRCGMTPIYAMNADGSNLREITPRECLLGEPHDPNPDWSPDGRRIAYVNAHDLWVMNADGRSPVRLTDNGNLEVGPDWSPDGRRIVFERFGKTGSEIVVMNADGTHVRRLTGGGGPRWRPVAAP